MLSGKYGKQSVNFVIHIGHVSNGLHDFFTQQGAIAFSHAMRGHAGGCFACIQMLRRGGIAAGVAVADHEWFQDSEVVRFVGRLHFVSQSLHHEVQHRNNPLTFIQRFGGQGFCRAGLIARISWTEVQRELRLAAASLLGTALIALMR